MANPIDDTAPVPARPPPPPGPPLPEASASRAAATGEARCRDERKWLRRVGSVKL
jgi:hypothetical protein